MLSAAAEWARMRRRVFSGTDPYLFSAAPSAIGATSGRTICACPPREVRPSAAVTCRTVK